MTNASRLTLSEKLPKASKTSTSEEISFLKFLQSSPKSSTLCCCPKRKSINFNQYKTSTLHAKNILICYDPAAVDNKIYPGNTHYYNHADRPPSAPSQHNKQIDAKTKDDEDSKISIVVARKIVRSRLQKDNTAGDAIFEYSNENGCVQLNRMISKEESRRRKWGNDEISNDTKYYRKIFMDCGNNGQSKHEKVQHIQLKCNDIISNSKETQVVCCSTSEQQKLIQRFNNIEDKNEENPLTNSNKGNTKTSATAIHVGRRDKMTVTTITANVSQSKQSESEVTLSTSSTISAAIPLPTVATRATPLTTVIKTVAVKRTPVNEAYTLSSLPTTTNSAMSNAVKHEGIREKAHNVCNITIVDPVLRRNENQQISEESSAPTLRTVKERIAAFVSGNDPAKCHDSSAWLDKSTGIHNHKKPSAVATSASESISSINSSHHIQSVIDRPHGALKVTTVITSPTTNASVNSTTHGNHEIVESSAPEVFILDLQKPILDNAAPQRSSAASGSISTTLVKSHADCASMPRHRNTSLSTTPGNDLTTNKQQQRFHGADNEAWSASPLEEAHTSTKLAALDSLDLAINLNLNDEEDSEDPYFVLQEYLERVKLEINEVFEVHKARQGSHYHSKLESSNGISNDLSYSPPPSGVFGSTIDAKINVNAENCVVKVGQEKILQSLSTLATKEPMLEETTRHPNANNNPIDTNRHMPVANLKDSPRLQLYNAVVSESANLTTAPSTKLKALSSPTVKSTKNMALLAVPTGAPTEVVNEDVYIWATKFLGDLDNLMGSEKPPSKIKTWISTASSPTSSTRALLLSTTTTAAVKSRYGKKVPADRELQGVLVLRPEKHTTIPLQSFSLDSNRLENTVVEKTGAARKLSTVAPSARSHISYKRTLSAPDASYQQPQHNDIKLFKSTSIDLPPLLNTQNNDDVAVDTAAILKIEETVPSVEHQPATATTLPAHGLSSCCEISQKTRQQRKEATDNVTVGGNNENIDIAGHAEVNKNILLSSTAATPIPNRERINHTILTTSAVTAVVAIPATTIAKRSNGDAAMAPANILNSSDATKKGSTSTIWTSEESILRSFSAVDEDNKRLGFLSILLPCSSTSSSACEEASGVMSSCKSGISLDSSGLDNDNNESGIGTATPPKDLFYWKSTHNDNEAVNSPDAMHKMKLEKSNSVAFEDPDVLEVLSLYNESQADDDIGGDDSYDDTVEEMSHPQHHLICQCHQPPQLKRSRGVQNYYNRNSRGLRRVPYNNSNICENDDDGHTVFDTIPYYDYECTDADASSVTSGSVTSSSTRCAVNAASLPAKAVVLRRKCMGTTTPIIVPHSNCSVLAGRGQKSRSHSLDASSLYLQHVHSSLARKLHQHQLHAGNHQPEERTQLSLALRQEPFQSLLVPTHFPELPSPSSASLHSGHENLGIQELTTKSNSAPLLLKQEHLPSDDFTSQKLTLRYSRSQSDRYLAEIEAVEACKWLRAAGFPQYAQMYEEHQFPIDLTNVAKDHTNLENDQLQSLYRRLCILNRCANMRLDQSHKPQTPQKEDSDDENFALSENWTFQPHIRRWSRVGEMGLELPPNGKLNVDKTESSSKESSPDRFQDDTYDETSTALSLALPGESAEASTTHDSGDSAAVRLRRTGSERFKDGAKAFLRRVESIKSRRRKRQNREGIVISGPQTLDLSELGQRSSMRKPDAIYSTPPSPSAVSPIHTFPKSSLFGNELTVPSHSESFLTANRASPKRTPSTPRSMRTSPLHFFSSPMPHLKEGKSDDSSSYYSDSQESSTGGKLTLRKTPSKTRRFLQRTGKVDDIGAHSDSECHQGRKLLIKDANANTTEIKVKKLSRGGSLNLGKIPKKREGGFRSASFRSRSTTRRETKTEETEISKKIPVMRWHSFQMEDRPQMIFRKCFTQRKEQITDQLGINFAAMSAGQLQIIRKLALVILTGHMERYCPSHRSGWNWELPKFIKKIKMPDYKDKRVFGVPLLLILQRTAQTLPYAVRAAFRWLQLNALDQIGLFRKSGVKSRILRLKEVIECTESIAECMDVFDTQQAYDVADMLKQYFRDLPESLLTTKMSETFVTVFQHLPPEVRLEAIQCAVLLLPDENREILYALLEFLRLVADNSQCNQMTANNLAVCLAPSLFHSSISTGSASVSASPRRRTKTPGVPDAKELTEAKASHECLAFMIENYKQIFTATKEKVSKCNFGYMEESKPVSLEALGEDMRVHNWRGYLFECTSATIKEGREKTRGWFTVTSLGDPNVEIAYKKVGDGHPLRLWRCVTEVEGPPKDVLEYIVKQRTSWDPNLLQSQMVKQLDDRTEIFQYTIDGQTMTDFCVVRSWQTELPRGACVIVETSVDHNAKAKPMYGAVHGVVLASRYLIEPCGGGRSRVMHLSRVDIKGKTPEWYNKSYGHICSHYLSRIRLAFKNVADGPESKV